MRKLLYILLLGLTFGMAYGCKRDAKMTVAELEDGEVPDMVTYNVTMLISDSGVIRYKASSNLWYNYEADPKNKYQYFPKGILIEQVDSLFNTVASITADTAYNYETKKLWHLIENVHIVNNEEENFYTNDLYWDMNRHKVYSDSFIRIERPDAILEGYGFTSDDQFTEYEIRKTSGIFPIDDVATPQDSLTADTTNVDSLKP